MVKITSSLSASQRVTTAPASVNRLRVFQNRIRRISYEVNQHLFQLIGIGLKRDVRAWLDAHLDSGFETGCASDQRDPKQFLAGRAWASAPVGDKPQGSDAALRNELR